MIDRNSRWDRQELYEKVWQFPLRKLAAEYNISDVGLAKTQGTEGRRGISRRGQRRRPRRGDAGALL
jgi:hypothetical protein